jgi:predicted secreted protein
MSEAIRVRAGGTFEIRLAGNPKAGFLWKVSVPPDQSDVVKLRMTPPWEPNPSQIGGPIVQIFSFEALKAGAVTLTFTYRRGFGKDRLSEDRFYDVVIENDGRPSDGHPDDTTGEV